MSKAQQMMLLAVSIIILASTLTIEMFYFKQSEQLFWEGNLKIYDDISLVPDWQRAIGQTMRGEDVKKLIREGDTFIRVATKECVTSFCTFKGMDHPKSYEYIDPSDKFVCAGCYVEDELVGLQFKEVGIDLIFNGQENYQSELSNYCNNLSTSYIDDRLHALEEDKSKLTGSLNNLEQEVLGPSAEQSSVYYNLLQLSVQYDTWVQEKARLEKLEIQLQDELSNLPSIQNEEVE